MSENASIKESLPSALIKLLADLGYHQLTPIQEQAIGPLLVGKDLIGQSKTGSGKTAAYTIPLLEKIETSQRVIQGLILCPTRELSSQVTREVRKLGRYKKDLFVVPLIGGEPFRAQMRSLMHGAHLLVGTPGRILDHLERKTFDFSQLKVLILDEADRMLDMGFREAIDAILKHTPRNRQTLLFSATFPDTIAALSQRYQREPVRITIKDDISLAIEEKIIETGPRYKLSTLLSFLSSQAPESAMIFCNTKLAVDEVCEGLRSKGINAERLHGDLEQNDRQKVLAKFRNRTVTILVATDVAARGLDISQVELVVNFDLPANPEVYVHRIGRTGRAGKTGLAVSFLTEMETPKIVAIEAYIKRPLPRSRWTVQASLSSAKAVVMATMYIGGGRKQKLRPTDILGALTQAAGLLGTEVGKIEIHDDFTYVAVTKMKLQTAISGIKNAGLKGRRFPVGLVQ